MVRSITDQIYLKCFARHGMAWYAWYGMVWHYSPTIVNGLTRIHLRSRAFDLVDGRRHRRYHQVVEQHLRVALSVNDVYEREETSISVDVHVQAFYKIGVPSHLFQLLEL